MRRSRLFFLALPCVLFLSDVQAEIEIPWDRIESVPVQVYDFPTPAMPIQVFEPDVQDFEQVDRPVLVFIGGFLPKVGLDSYEELLRYVASKGILVLAPIYELDRRSNVLVETGAGLAKAYLPRFTGVMSSRRYAIHVERALRYFNVEYRRETGRTLTMAGTWTLYGHSLGARIATALIERSPRRFQGVILDGFSDNEFDSSGYCVDEDFETDEFRVDKTLREGWPVLTSVWYVEDRKYQSVTGKAYQCLPARGKQYSMIFNYRRSSDGVEVQADHVAPMSNDVPRRALRGMVDSVFEDIHGYPLDLTMNEVDRYGSMTLLPALAYAHVFWAPFGCSEDWPNNEWSLQDSCGRAAIAHHAGKVMYPRQDVEAIMINNKLVRRTASQIGSIPTEIPTYVRWNLSKGTFEMSPKPSINLIADSK